MEKAIAIGVANHYLTTKNITTSEISSFCIRKNYKLGYDGYNIYIKFNAEKNLVYEYYYSIIEGKFKLRGIYDNPYSNTGGGISILIDRVITPVYELDYDTKKISMKYSIIDFLLSGKDTDFYSLVNKKAVT